MNDASEHLAPVSYLPWATPGVTPAGGASPTARDSSAGDDSMAGDATAAGGDATAEHDPAASEHVGGEQGGRGQRSQRASRSGATDRPQRSGRGGRVSEIGDARRASRGGAARSSRSADADGEHEQVVAETGPERDERIDRLIVSRLRRSALSIAEVRAVLAEHGLDEIEIDEWIERYERLGYLDDARLAEQLVHVSAGRRGRGSGAIMQELTRRGIDGEAARAAIADLDPDTEIDNARTTAERRARQLRGLDRQTAERRLSAFLQRRGYGGDVVRQVVTEVLAADGS